MRTVLSLLFFACVQKWHLNHVTVKVWGHVTWSDKTLLKQRKKRLSSIEVELTFRPATVLCKTGRFCWLAHRETYLQQESYFRLQISVKKHKSVIGFVCVHALTF